MAKLRSDDLRTLGYIREPSCDNCDQPHSSCTCDDQEHAERMGLEKAFQCKSCGAPSAVDPSDQSPPPDYCQPGDHE
jgi:hypothetical protein